MRSSFIKAIGLVLLMSLAAQVYGRAQGQKSTAARRSAAQRNMLQKQKLAEAEAAADRLINRFHETLDFAPVFDESFVTEPNLRRRAVTFKGDSNLPPDISEPLAERAYAAILTYLHLFAEYKLIQDKQEVPPEVDRSPLVSKYFGQADSGKTHFKTPEEVEEAIADMNQLSEMYRKHFSPDAFKSHLYRQGVAEEQQRARQYNHNVPRIEHGNVKFEISAQTPVYIVRREFFDYYFIEEQGAPKLFYVDILPNFKLF